MFSFSSRLWYNSRRISKAGEVSLYLQVVIDRKHGEFPLKLKWPVDRIDLTTGTLLSRFRGKDMEASDYNLIISSEIAKHIEIFTTYRLSKKPLDIKIFAREVKIFDQKECFSSYIERERNTRYRKKDIEKKTWENAHAVMLAVLRYDPVPLFKNIDKRWMEGFKTHLANYEYKRSEKGKPAQKYLPSTIADRVKTVKTYLQRAASEPMIYVNPEALKYKNPKVRHKTTFLNREELRRMMLLLEADLTDKQYRVLKAWLFMAFTSIRISDLYEANSTWQIQDDFLTFIPFKNRKRGRIITIPLLPMAKSFIASATGYYFTLPNQVDYNQTLKFLADKAEIKKKLTAHVARHTFGYLYMTTVGNLYGLKEILGHSKIETTERYSHLDEDYILATTKQIQQGFEDLMLRKVI